MRESSYEPPLLQSTRSAAFPVRLTPVEESLPPAVLNTLRSILTCRPARRKQPGTEAWRFYANAKNRLLSICANSEEYSIACALVVRAVGL